MTVYSRSSTRRHLNLVLAAGGNITRRSPLRTTILVLSLSALLFPFLAAVSISEGIKVQAKIAVEEGADFYVTGDSAGSTSPLPLASVGRFAKLPGVSHVVPRIVGRAYLNERVITMVGMPQGKIPDSLILHEGRTIKEEGDVIVGSTLASRDGLSIGSRFYLPVNKWKRFTVVGVFSSECSIWSSNLIYMALDDAGELFRMKGMATDFLIYAEPNQSAIANIHLQYENDNDPPFRAQSRDLINSYFMKGYESRAGILTSFYMVAFALAIPLILILSGLGWQERKREIGTLKAVGWQTLDVMKVVAWENVFISLISAWLALAVAFVWIRLFNGFFIAQFFLGDSGLMPGFPVPSRFIPIPVFLAFLLALTVTMTGSLYNTWRTAVVPAAEAMR